MWLKPMTCPPAALALTFNTTGHLTEAVALVAATATATISYCSATKFDNWKKIHYACS